MDASMSEPRKEEVSAARPTIAKVYRPRVSLLPCPAIMCIVMERSVASCSCERLLLAEPDHRLDPLRHGTACHSSSVRTMDVVENPIPRQLQGPLPRGDAHGRPPALVRSKSLDSAHELAMISCKDRASGVAHH